jgi:sporulation protein YlmC with PRC-barrel domain
MKYAAAAMASFIVATAAIAQTTVPGNMPNQPATTTNSNAPMSATGMYYTLTPNWNSGAFRTSELVGKSVYNTANERIGEVEDVLISTDGKVNAVVLGVGGFLGIGERKVAVVPSALSFRREGDGVANYRVNMTKGDLTNAPEFRWPNR